MTLFWPCALLSCQVNVGIIMVVTAKVGCEETE